MAFHTEARGDGTRLMAEVLPIHAVFIIPIAKHGGEMSCNLPLREERNSGKGEKSPQCLPVAEVCAQPSKSRVSPVLNPQCSRHARVEGCELLHHWKEDAELDGPLR